MAASRSAATPKSSTIQPRRVSFAKISEPLEVPELLALQTDSFAWLIGDDAWKAEVEQQLAAGRAEFGIFDITPEIIAHQQETADRFFRLGLIPKEIVVAEAVWTPPAT